MVQFWNERYGQADFVYGEQPNLFFKTRLDLLPTGRILLPAEGEGRNAVYAAQSGWEACAFDQSVEGQKKALRLAQQRGVTIDYFVNTSEALPYQVGQFDVLGLVFAHFPASIKSAFLQKLATYLKPGGTVIFEAFSKKHLAYNSANPQVGGPKELGMLFSAEEIEADFRDFEVLYLREEEVALAEGAFHNGLGSVLRFVGAKKT